MTREVAKTLSLAEQNDWFQKRRSRRAVLKGGLAGAGTVIGGAALLGPTGSSLGGLAAAAIVVVPLARAGVEHHTVERIGHRPVRPPHLVRQ